MDIAKVAEWYASGQDYQAALDLLLSERVDVSGFQHPTPRNFELVRTKLFLLAECNEFDLIVERSQDEGSGQDNPPGDNGNDGSEPPSDPVQEPASTGDGNEAPSDPVQEPAPTGDGSEPPSETTN